MFGLIELDFGLTFWARFEIQADLGLPSYQPKHGPIWFGFYAYNFDHCNKYLPREWWLKWSYLEGCNQITNCLNFVKDNYFFIPTGPHWISHLIGSKTISYWADSNSIKTQHKRHSSSADPKLKGKDLDLKIELVQAQAQCFAFRTELGKGPSPLQPLGYGSLSFLCLPPLQSIKLNKHSQQNNYIRLLHNELFHLYLDD